MQLYSNGDKAQSPQNSPETKLEYLIGMGEEQLRKGDRETARQVFQLALKLDPGNERATLSLFSLTEDTYEARELLKTMLIFHPQNSMGLVLLGQTEAKITELEFMVTGSAYLKLWQDKEKLHNDRVRLNRDSRAEPITKMGKLLLQAGYVNEEQLDSAVSLQRMLSQLDNHQPLGQVLKDYGYITQEQLEEVLHTQEDEFRSQLY